MTATTRRMTIRLAPEDEQWLAAEAADEGLDPAVMVRVILARLRQGRPALYREAIAEARARDPHAAISAAQRVLGRHPLNAQMSAPMSQLDVSGERAYPVGGVSGEVGEPAQPLGDAQSAYDPRSDEPVEGMTVEEYDNLDPPPAAIPLRLVAREKYNPGVR